MPAIEREKLYAFSSILTTIITLGDHGTNVAISEINKPLKNSREEQVGEVSEDLI